MTDVAAPRTSATARRSRRGSGLAALAVLGAGALAAWAAWASPLFAFDLDRVELVSDGSGVRPGEVEEALRAFAGVPLTRLDVGAAENAVGEIGRVDEVAIERSWPRGLIVRVVERVPVAAIRTAQGGYAVVDSEGEPIGDPVSGPGTLPVLSVPVGSDAARILAAALVVVDAVDGAAFVVSEVGAETEDTVRLLLADGTVVVWGGPEESALKARVLEVLLETEGGAGVVIDLSAPTLPVVQG